MSPIRCPVAELRQRRFPGMRYKSGEGEQRLLVCLWGLPRAPRVWGTERERENREKVNSGGLLFRLGSKKSWQ